MSPYRRNALESDNDVNPEGNQTKIEREYSIAEKGKF